MARVSQQLPPWDLVVIPMSVTRDYRGATNATIYVRVDFLDVTLEPGRGVSGLRRLGGRNFRQSPVSSFLRRIWPFSNRPCHRRRVGRSSGFSKWLSHSRPRAPRPARPRSRRPAAGGRGSRRGRAATSGRRVERRGRIRVHGRAGGDVRRGREPFSHPQLRSTVSPDLLSWNSQPRTRDADRGRPRTEHARIDLALGSPLRPSIFNSSSIARARPRSACGTQA
jgi:hypothetical protein